MERERERERERSAQLVSTVADSKTPLSKEVRSTSKMVNGRPGVGQAFHDLGSRSHEKITLRFLSRKRSTTFRDGRIKSMRRF